MDNAASGILIGRDELLARVHKRQSELGRDGTDYLWVTGDAGSGKTHFLDTCASRAERDGWQVLRGQCNQETRTDPYGPFLSMLGLCFDRAGRLINDRSVYSIVDQISLDDVFDAVSDIPGMAVVAFGIKVGMSIFEARRSPDVSDDLLNRNFEFILQVLQQIGTKRKKPLLLILDDAHLASTTTTSLLEYILTRIQDVRLFVLAARSAGSPEEGLRETRESTPRLADPDCFLHLPPLSHADLHALLSLYDTRAIAEPLASTLVEFSQGMPGRLLESLRLAELESKRYLEETRSLEMTDSLLQTLVARQLAQTPSDRRALLECAALIGQRVPLDVITALPLCTYLGESERDLLTSLIELAERAVLLAWNDEQSVRFASLFVHRFLLDGMHPTVQRRDHLRIAESWQSARGEGHPAQLAEHYLAGGDPQRALEFAVQSADALMSHAAYPEAVQSYEMALEALRQQSEPDLSRQYEILHAMSLAAEQAGDWEGAMVRLHEAMALAQGDPAREAELYAGLSWLCFQRGEIQGALDALAHSAERYALLGDARGQAQADYYRGVVYSSQKEWQRAVACFERYLRAAETLALDEGRASAYVELGNLYRLQREWAQAETFLKQGIEQATEDKDFVVLARGYNYLGSCYALQGDPASIDTLQRALDIVSDRTKQPAQEARIQNTMAETLARMNRWEEAEEG